MKLRRAGVVYVRVSWLELGCEAQRWRHMLFFFNPLGAFNTALHDL
jgi:hypothetical protein